MSQFLDAINSSSRTENNMRTNISSQDSLVDLFFRIGAMRGSDIIPDFSAAFVENKELATRIALWARDVRGGAGERQIFKDIFKYLIEHDEDLAIKVMNKIPELGRWDDVLVAIDTPIEKYALELIAMSLNGGDQLCAKWMPRKGKVANKFRKYMNMTPKEYRKILVYLTNVVETKMCNKEFSKIEFSKVPSLAHSRYSKAFNRNAPVEYQKYIDSLQKGKDGVKINAGAVYPYDVVKTLAYGDKEIAIEQWKALPNYCEGSIDRILTVIDTSESMKSLAGSNKTVSCVDVALSLGIYLSERLEGAYKDHFITFSSNPELQILKGNLLDRYTQLRRANWSMNTDLHAVFNLILNNSMRYNVPKDEMPTMILILSDMEFDQCTSYDDFAIEMIRRKYEKAGYVIPKVVFWNIQSRSRDNIPVIIKDNNTALVSGFSPSIMKSILGSKDFTPKGIMLETIMNERYSF